jgi:hypothetical protein
MKSHLLGIGGRAVWKRAKGGGGVGAWEKKVASGWPVEGEWGVSRRRGLGEGPPGRSGRVESDLNAPGQDGLEGSGWEPGVPPGIQETKGEVLDGTEAFRESLPQETALFQ